MNNIFEKITRKIIEIRKISWVKFIYYNYLCSSIVRDKKCYMVTGKNSQIEIHKSAKIFLHANLHTNYNKVLGSKAECYIRLRENAQFTVNGKFFVYSNATIEVHSKGKLSVGQSYINCGAVIVCAKEIIIGNGVSIAREVFIYDWDHHNIVNLTGESQNQPKAVLIEDHVWIGVKAVILKGTTLRKGSVVGAGTLVNKEVDEGLLVTTILPKQYKPILWDI